MGEPVEKKQKVSNWKHEGLCICCNPQCDAAMAKLAKLNPDRHAYVLLPQEPKDLTLLKYKPNAKELLRRDKRSLNRRRFLRALGPSAVTRVNDVELSSSTKFRIASLHFHEDIFQSFTRSKDNKIQMPTDIPASLARSLSDQGLAFTDTDRQSDGTYSPLPHYPPVKWEADIRELERKDGIGGQDVTPVRRTQHNISTPTMLEHDQLKAQLERYVQRESDLQKLKEDLDKREAECDLFVTGDEAYGLTRNRISCKHWHKKNPRAARHLFGFPDWKETVCILHALFRVLPPTKYVSKKDEITPFEQYVIAYMRMHRGMSYTMLSFIFGRDSSHCGRLVNPAMKK